jgi:hypothetical protein
MGKIKQEDLDRKKIDVKNRRKERDTSQKLVDNLIKKSKDKKKK